MSVTTQEMPLDVHSAVGKPAAMSQQRIGPRWPLFVIGAGFLLTIGWVAFLGWAAISIVLELW
jgi:hypothetical protein